MPENVKVIGELAFAGCESLVSVKNAGGVTVIKRQAFEGCRYLVDFTIGANVESIGIGAFWGCEDLKSVTIPGSVTSIGYLAFCDCTSLEAVVFLGKSPSGMEDSCILDSAMKVYYPETYADSYKSIVPDEKFAGSVIEDIPEVETDAEIAAALLPMRVWLKTLKLLQNTVGIVPGHQDLPGFHARKSRNRPMPGFRMHSPCLSC